MHQRHTHRPLSKDTQRRLTAYSMMAGALVAGMGQAEGAIEYVEVDNAFGLGGVYDIDFDGDGTLDATIAQNFSSGTNIVGFYSQNNQFVGYGYPSYGSYVYASALPAGVDVGASVLPNMYVAASGPFPFATMNYGSGIGAWAPIFSSDTIDAFIGMQFLSGAGTVHYAWIRCKVNNAMGFEIVSYAWETDALVSIVTGDTGPLLPPASPALSLMASDAGDANDGSDLALAFSQAVDETTVAEYRAIAVKSAAAGSFDLAAAEVLASDRFVSVTPSGTDPAIDFAGILDADGDAISGGNTYACFVLSMADAATAIGNTLSDSSNHVALVTAASAAQNLSGQDFDDNGDPTDFRVRFDPAPNEATVTEYRVLVVDSISVPGFDLATAQAVASGNYTSISPSGAPTDIFLDAAATDVDGDPIQQFLPYQFFVLSVADGSIATEDVLAGPSNVVTLRFVDGLPSPESLGWTATIQDGQLVVDATPTGESHPLRWVGMDGRVLAEWSYSGGRAVFALPGAGFNAEAPIQGLLQWQLPEGAVALRPRQQY